MMNASELIFIRMDVAQDRLELTREDQGKTLTLDPDEKGMAQ